MSRRLLVVAAVLAIPPAIDLALAAEVARAVVSTREPMEVVTEPPEPGLRLGLAGRVYRTDRRGRAFIPPADLRRLPRRVLEGRILDLGMRIRVLPDRRPDGLRFRIDRWFTRGRATGVALVGTVHRSSPVRFSFVSRTGRRLPHALLDSVHIRRNDGAEFTLTPDQLARPVVLQANRMARIRGALVSKNLLYRIQRVSVGGANVVNRSQQYFRPSETRSVRVRLLFYVVGFQARDRLFGFPIGSGIRLVYPDGGVRVHRFERDGEVVIAALPRGSYRVSVDAPGLSPSTPVSITRDQVTRLQVLSYIDIAVLVLGFAGLLVALVLVPRRALRRRLSPVGRLRRWSAVRRAR